MDHSPVPHFFLPFCFKMSSLCRNKIKWHTFNVDLTLSKNFFSPGLQICDLRKGNQHGESASAQLRQIAVPCLTNRVQSHPLFSLVTDSSMSGHRIGSQCWFPLLTDWALFCNSLFVSVNKKTCMFLNIWWTSSFPYGHIVLETFSKHLDDLLVSTE